MRAHREAQRRLRALEAQQGGPEAPPPFVVLNAEGRPRRPDGRPYTGLAPVKAYASVEASPLAWDGEGQAEAKTTRKDTRP